MKPYYEHAGITIYHGDCRDILPTISVPACFTDPPYNAGKVRVRRQGAARGMRGESVMAKAGKAKRLAIVFDGALWHVRRIASIEHDIERDLKVYRCDAPIVNDCPTLADVPIVSQLVDRCAALDLDGFRCRRTDTNVFSYHGADEIYCGVYPGDWPRWVTVSLCPDHVRKGEEPHREPERERGDK